MKALKSVLAAVSFFAVSQSAMAQFAVIDVGSITQQILTVQEQVKQNLAWMEQYRQMYTTITNQVEQIQKARATLENMTGSRLLGLVKNEIATNATIPSDVASILGAIEDTAQLTAKIKSIATNGIRSTDARGRQIVSLMGEINGTSDAKGVAEINARIAAETANVQNDTNRILLAKSEADMALRDNTELDYSYNGSLSGKPPAALTAVTINVGQ